MCDVVSFLPTAVPVLAVELRAALRHRDIPEHVVERRF